MTPEEIRSMPIGSTGIESDIPQVAMNSILREICAQLAEKNAFARIKAEKHKPTETQNVVRSAARRSSENKRFYVEHWGIEAEENMMIDFTPVAGQKHWQDLEVGEGTTGRFGIKDGANIVRRQ